MSYPFSLEINRRQENFRILFFSESCIHAYKVKPNDVLQVCSMECFHFMIVLMLSAAQLVELISLEPLYKTEPSGHVNQLQNECWSKHKTIVLPLYLNY